MNIIKKELLLDRHIISGGSMKKVFASEKITESGAAQMEFMRTFWKNRYEIGREQTTVCRYSHGVEFETERAKVVFNGLKCDMPWESSVNYASFLYDKRDERYKCWYVVRVKRAEKLAWVGGLNQAPVNAIHVAYAVSKDGFHWERPKLEFWKWDGLPTNLLGEFPQDGGVTWDDKEVRFLSVLAGCDSAMAEQPDPKQRSWIQPLYSYDGIHWKRMDGVKVYGFCDSQNIAIYDHMLERYVLYLRGWDQGRCIRRIEVGKLEELADIKESDMQVVLRPDNGDMLDEDYYTNAISCYPGDPSIRLLFPSVFVHHNDSFYVRVAVSRDGRKFDWVSRSPAVTPVDSDGRPIKGMYTCTQMVSIDEKMALPILEIDNYHEQAYNEWFYTLPQSYTGYSWALWEKDRLAGLYAQTQGEIYTVPFLLEGNRLLINAKTNAWGAIRVEVLLADANPEINYDVPAHGLSMEEGDENRGDISWEACTWKGSGDLSAIKGRYVVLHFLLTDAKLFGFAIGDE